MKTQLQQEIFETIKEIVHLERVKEQLEVTRQELNEAHKTYKRLDRDLRRELRDIERLEGLSTKAIFHKILGNKEQQLEKERQQYLELSLSEADTKNSIQLLEYEVNLLEAKIGSKNILVKKLEELKIKRESEIIKTDPSLRIELLGISKKIENSYQIKAELEEAIEVGEVCFSLTRQMIEHLSKVKNWGQWSGSRRKHNMNRRYQKEAIDRARNLSYQIKHHLNIFAKELADLNKRVNFNTDTSSFGDFSEFFFNNIITDWIMQQQLTKAIASANYLKSNLENYTRDLKLEKENMIAGISKLNNKRDELLTN